MPRRLPLRLSSPGARSRIGMAHADVGTRRLIRWMGGFRGRFKSEVEAAWELVRQGFAKDLGELLWRRPAFVSWTKRPLPFAEERFRQLLGDIPR